MSCAKGKPCPRYAVETAVVRSWPDIAMIFKEVKSYSIDS